MMRLSRIFSRSRQTSRIGNDSSLLGGSLSFSPNQVACGAGVILDGSRNLLLVTFPEAQSLLGGHDGKPFCFTVSFGIYWDSMRVVTSQPTIPPPAFPYDLKTLLDICLPNFAWVCIDRAGLLSSGERDRG